MYHPLHRRANDRLAMPFFDLEILDGDLNEIIPGRLWQLFQQCTDGSELRIQLHMAPEIREYDIQTVAIAPDGDVTL